MQEKRGSMLKDERRTLVFPEIKAHCQYYHGASKLTMLTQAN